MGREPGVRRRQRTRVWQYTPLSRGGRADVWYTWGAPLTQPERDKQIADLTRQYFEIRREHGHLTIKHDQHLKNLAKVMASAQTSPRRFDVQGQDLVCLTGSITWPTWEEVRDNLSALKEADRRMADVKSQLATLGITI